jgi:hypothetical protein
LEIASVYLAGFLAERFVARDVSVDTAHTDVVRAAQYLSGLASLDEFVQRVRQRVANLWTEVIRVAEALDKQGSMDAGEVARTARMPPLAWTR